MCDNNLLLNIICAAEAAGELDEPIIPTPKIRKYLVHPAHSNMDGENHFYIFYENIRNFPLKFFEYFRMSITSFDELLKMLRPYLTKQQNKYKEPYQRRIKTYSYDKVRKTIQY